MDGLVFLVQNRRKNNMNELQLTKLQEYILLILGSNDAESMSEDRLKAVLLMASKCIPELSEVLPGELYIFGEKFLVEVENNIIN